MKTNATQATHTPKRYSTRRKQAVVNAMLAGATFRGTARRYRVSKASIQFWLAKHNPQRPCPSCGRSDRK